MRPCNHYARLAHSCLDVPPARIPVHALHLKHDLVLLARAAAARLVAAAAVGGAAPTRRVRPRADPARASPACPGSDAATASDRPTTSAYDATTTDSRAAHRHDSTTTTDSRAAHSDHTTTTDSRAADSHHATTADTRAAHGHDSTTADSGTADGNYAATTHTCPADGHDSATTDTHATHRDQSSRPDRVPLQGRRTRPHPGRVCAFGRAQCAGDADRLLGLLVTALCPLRVSGRADHHR